MAPDAPPFSIVPEGESALTVRFAGAPAHALPFVRAAEHALGAARLPTPCELAPAYAALTVVYDPLGATYAQMHTAISQALASLEAVGTPSARTVVIPVCYGSTPQTASLGPDLASLAAHCGLAPVEVARLHAARTYRIDMLGFMPGFPYLSGLDERLRCPRLATPRTAIPAGSVGIGDNQTGVYPLASPGGWHLIGRTPARLFDPTRAQPVPYGAGDSLRFEPIDLETFHYLVHQESHGHSCLHFEEASR